MRRTKIVATLGPATDSPETIQALLQAGTDVVRLNFSHGTAEDHKKRANMVREASVAVGKAVGILGDLQGPKIRIDRFKEGKVYLKKGAEFILDAELGADDGDQYRVGLTYKTLPQEVKAGNELLLDDGRLVLNVTRTEGHKVFTTVGNSSWLSNNKGINLRGGGLSADALTEKDKEDIKTAAEINVDFLAVSFPRSAADMNYARKLLTEAGGEAALVAKLERAEITDRDVLDSVIKASDVVMVARGDLGVEIGDAHLPLTQKRIIKRARKHDRAVITATQMMESMITNPIPTRAEVFDVANAVMDGTDAVMLSGETAIGEDPPKVVETMATICEQAEQAWKVKKSRHRVGSKFRRTDEGIAMATMYLANHMNVKAVAGLTESGATTVWMSRISSGLPIYALTTHPDTCRKMSVYRGVYPVLLKEKITDPREANRIAVEYLLKEQVVDDGDLVIITKGDLMGIHGGTNMLKMIRVGEHKLDSFT